MTTKKKQIHPSIVCTGIIVLGSLEAYALFLGYNGTLLKLTILTIGLIVGGFGLPLDKYIKQIKLNK